MQCKTPCFSHLPQQGIYSPPVSLAEDNVSFHFFSSFTCDWYRRIVHRAEEEKVRMLIVCDENKENPEKWKSTGGMEICGC